MQEPVHTAPAAGWHLKREIQLGHLITTLAMAGAVAMYVVRLDQRLVLLEQEVKYRREVDAQQDAAALRAAQAIDKRLERIDMKLDTLLHNAKK
jgi:hypothetical protein